MAGIAVQNQI